MGYFISEAFFAYVAKEIRDYIPLNEHLQTLIIFVGDGVSSRGQEYFKEYTNCTNFHFVSIDPQSSESQLGLRNISVPIEEIKWDSILREFSNIVLIYHCTCETPIEKVLENIRDTYRFQQVTPIHWGMGGFKRVWWVPFACNKECEMSILNIHNIKNIMESKVTLRKVTPPSPSSLTFKYYLEEEDYPYFLAEEQIFKSYYRWVFAPVF
jgi:hypothetical protein